MTGYKPRRTLYRLTFEDPDFDGLEVTCKGASIERLMEIAALGDLLEAMDQENPDLQQLRTMFAPFAAVLVSWNVVDDDEQPVPATLDGLLAQEVDFASEIMTGYVRAMTQAPPPLPGASTSGASSPAPPTPGLAAASTALPSS